MNERPPTFLKALRRRQMLALLAAASARGESPTSVGFSFGTYGMKTIATEDALRALAEIGYDGVELCLRPGWPADPAMLSREGKARIREQLRQTGLALPAVLDELPLLGTAVSRAFNLERLKLAAEFGHAVCPSGAPCLDTVLGLKSGDWEDCKLRIADELRAWASVADSEGMTVGIKPHAGQAMDTPEKALWMIRQVNSPRIRLIFDYSHMAVGQFSLRSSLTRLLPYTVFISLKDARGTPDRYEFMLPGDGKTAYVEYFRLLRDFHYRGYISVEVSAMVFNQPGYDPIATARLCYNRLAPKFSEAGLSRAL